LWRSPAPQRHREERLQTMLGRDWDSTGVRSPRALDGVGWKDFRLAMLGGIQEHASPTLTCASSGVGWKDFRLAMLDGVQEHVTPTTLRIITTHSTHHQTIPFLTRFFYHGRLFPQEHNNVGDITMIPLLLPFPWTPRLSTSTDLDPASASLPCRFQCTASPFIASFHDHPTIHSDGDNDWKPRSGIILEVIGC